MAVGVFLGFSMAEWNAECGILHLGKAEEIWNENNNLQYLFFLMFIFVWLAAIFILKFA